MASFLCFLGASLLEKTFFYGSPHDWHVNQISHCSVKAALGSRIFKQCLLRVESNKNRGEVATVYFHLLRVVFALTRPPFSGKSSGTLYGVCRPFPVPTPPRAHAALQTARRTHTHSLLCFASNIWARCQICGVRVIGFSAWTAPGRR